MSFSNKLNWRGVIGVILIGLVAAGAWFVIQRDSDVPSVSSGPTHIEQIIRVNPEQYRWIVRDLFGGNIQIKGRLVASGKRVKGLLAVGAAEVSMSSLAFEAAENVAREVAGQVVSEQNRAELMPCKPAVETEFDSSCAQLFIATVGRLLYRRPLDKDELQSLMNTALKTVEDRENFYQGLEKSLSSMLVSPNFLFRIEEAEPDPDNRGDYRLTAFTKASRLSFLLWNSTPDSMLLDVAESGLLHTKKGLNQQLNRMLGSARFEAGVRAFFTDMLGFDDFDRLSKDGLLFPKFTRQIVKDAREQALLTLVDHLVIQERDYRDLFTTRKTFLTPSLAALASVPHVQGNQNAVPDHWISLEYPERDPRAGLLAQPAFVALHAHPGRTSPTLRGKALREFLLCQEVPPPPGDVDFSLVQDMNNPKFKTTRQRFNAHASVPACAGCHKITDPIGLALENFDADGSFRFAENGIVIDASGELDGITYDDPIGLGQVLRDNPNIPSCLVNRVFSYGASRAVTRDDREWLRDVRSSFAKSGYTLPGLLRTIATSDHFYRGSAPDLEESDAPESEVASITQSQNRTVQFAQETNR